MKQNTRIAMIIAPNGFRDEEFFVPKKQFEEHNARVEVFSTKKGIAKGSRGQTFDVKYSLVELDVKNFDAIVYVGGPGTPIVRADEKSTTIAKEAFKEHKIIGAICWAPTILAKAGILKNKKATCWNGNDDEFNMLTSKYLEKQGATFTGDSCTVDGNIITADGPMSAEEFAKEMIKKLV